MEVKRPLLSMYQGPDVCSNSLTRSSSWLERVSRKLYTKPDMRSNICSLERAYSSVVPMHRVLGTPEEPVVYYYPTEMPYYSTWKPSVQHLKHPLTFHTLPDPGEVAKDKSCGLLNTSLKAITQKLLSICHLQHFCDLVSDVVNAVPGLSNSVMALKNTPDMRKINDLKKDDTVVAGNLGFCESIITMPLQNAPNGIKISDDGNLKMGPSVKAENIVSKVCESASTFEVGYHCVTSQNDNSKSVAVMNCAVLDVTRMSENSNKQKMSTIGSENLKPVLHETVTEVEIDHYTTSCNTSKKETVVMMNDFCHNSPAGETRPRMKNKLKNVDQEMVSRKQRRINKHSKKRKRRMKKRQKMSPGHAVEKGDTSVTKAVPSSTSSQVKCKSELAVSSGRRTMLHDWEDSDDDLFIVFDDEVDGASCIVPEVDSTIGKDNSDLWIEFDSLTIVSGNSSASVDCRSYSSEISIQFDSDSDLEYESDCGQIFIDTDDFDSFSGLVFCSDSVDGCSGLPSQPYVHCPSFVSSTTTSYEQVNDCVGIYEINKRWRQVTSDIEGKPRLPQRVTFAPEEELVAVFPVDMIDRKSEWEQFALERFRFKRRIDEFEKIIEPYLTTAHREKTFGKLSGAPS